MKQVRRRDLRESALSSSNSSTSSPSFMPYTRFTRGSYIHKGRGGRGEGEGGMYGQST